MKKPKTAGGKRKGAGRPKGEPTKALGLRVPTKWHKHLSDMVRAEVKRLSALEAGSSIHMANPLSEYELSDVNISIEKCLLNDREIKL